MNLTTKINLIKSIINFLIKRLEKSITKAYTQDAIIEREIKSKEQQFNEYKTKQLTKREDIANSIISANKLSTTLNNIL